MGNLISLSGFLPLLQAGKKLVYQKVSFFRVYSIEISGSDAGLQEMIQDILRGHAWKNDLIFYEIRSAGHLPG
jgi:hypothetical protein